MLCNLSQEKVTKKRNKITFIGMDIYKDFKKKG
jgi:hypothetical protein